MAFEKGIEKERADSSIKSSENYLPVEIGCLKFLGSCGFLNAGLDEVSTAKASFLKFDSNGMEDERFEKKIADPYEKLQSIDSF